jgi:hypothetical protein
MPQRALNASDSWYETAEEYAPSPKPSMIDDERDRMRAAGVPKRMLDDISLSLSQQDFYRLCQFLEERAKASENYFEIRQAVLFVEMLRSQARQQAK